MTFRAGGWTATSTTFQALADKGFIADSSALNWARIEEWQGYELYTWTMETLGADRRHELNRITRARLTS